MPIRTPAARVPEVSVLLPVFDAAPTLGACLRSIARQTFRDFECVVVDDGSTDAGAARVEAVAAADPRFRLIRAPHRGLVAALNRGLAACRGRFVARMDADDCMHRDRLARQTEALRADASLAAVGSWVRFFPRAALADGMRRYEAWINGMRSVRDVAAEAFVECPVVHPTLFARREVLAALGYRDVGWPEDYDLLLRLHAAGHAVGVVPARLLAKRHTAACASRSDAAYGEDRFRACKAAHLAEGLLARGDGYVLWGYGSTGRALRRALLQRGKRPEAIVEVHPRRLGNRIHGAPVIAPEALPHWRHLPLVASVSGAAARGEIRDALRALGYRESRDFVCAA